MVHRVLLIDPTSRLLPVLDPEADRAATAFTLLPLSFRETTDPTALAAVLRQYAGAPVVLDRYPDAAAAWAILTRLRAVDCCPDRSVLITCPAGWFAADSLLRLPALAVPQVVTGVTPLVTALEAVWRRVAQHGTGCRLSDAR